MGYLIIWDCMASIFALQLPLQSNLTASALSRAEQARAGGALLLPMVAASIMPALDSNPTNIIDRGWGQDGLRKTTKSSRRKSLPQPNGSKALREPVRQLEPSARDWCGKESRMPVGVPFGVRRATASAVTPFTDRGVEICNDCNL